MPFLLDTCSLSEFVSRKPNPRAVEQLISLPREQIYISTITIGEIEQGIHEMDPCPKRDFLAGWLENHVLVAYASRTFPVDVMIAREWGMLNAALLRSGRKMPVKDSLIAATALVHNLTVVTRNEADFAPSGVKIFNPWK